MYVPLDTWCHQMGLRKQEHKQIAISHVIVLIGAFLCWLIWSLIMIILFCYTILKLYNICSGTIDISNAVYCSYWGWSCRLVHPCFFLAHAVNLISFCCVVCTVLSVHYCVCNISELSACLLVVAVVIPFKFHENMEHSLVSHPH